jgi:hypothetical protein
MDVFRFYLMLVQLAFCSNLIFQSRCENYQLMWDGADVQLVWSIVFALEHGLLRTCSDSLQLLSCALRVGRVAPNLSTPRRRKSKRSSLTFIFSERLKPSSTRSAWTRGVGGAVGFRTGPNCFVGDFILNVQVCQEPLFFHFLITIIHHSHSSLFTQFSVSKFETTILYFVLFIWQSFFSYWFIKCWPTCHRKLT